MTSAEATGLRVVRGAGLGALLPALVEELRRRRDPFERPWLCVPNREVQSFVKNGVAEALGVCMNYEMTSLDRAVTGLARAHGVDGELWTPLSLARALLLLFSDARDEGGELWRAVGPLLDAVPPTSDGLVHEGTRELSVASRERRAYRVAVHLARLLLDYAVTHPGLLERWAAGEAPTTAPGSWQAELWRRALRLAAEQHLRFCVPSDLVARLPAPLESAPILVFGHAYLSPLERHLVEELATRASVTCFLDTVVHDDELGASPSSPLARWSGPASLTCRSLELKAVHVETVASPPPEHSSPLGRLRACLAAPGRDPGDGDLGDAISVIGAPGPRREAEVIADRVWQRLATTPDQRLSEVAVCSAQYEAQIPWLEDRFAAQHRLLHSAPHGGRSSRLLDVAVDLLELPGKGARRDAVLAVLTHACFRGHVASRGYSALVADAGIYLGLDGGDEELGYLDGAPRFHWRQGLTRLQLGALLDGRAAVVSEGAPLVSTELPWARDDVKQLHAWASSLLADLHELSSWRLSGAGWARALEDLVRTYLAPRNETDGTHWAALLAAVRALEQADRVAPRATEHDGGLLSDDVAPLSYAVAVEMVRDQLGTLGGARGQFLTGGVAVSRLVKNRAVPFRSVFVCGLGEGVYPSREPRDPLDVRADVEVSSRQLKELAFLQAVLSAEEQLVLTWTCHDTAKDAPLAPSPLIEELCDAMPALAPRREPLAAHDASAVDGARPSLVHDAQAARRADARALRTELSHFVEHETGAPTSFLPSLALWQDTLCADEAVHARAGLARPAEGATRDVRGPRTQRLEQWSFVDLLKDPVEAAAKRMRLTGWDLRHDDEALVDAEPFAVEKRAMGDLARDVLRRCFAAHPSEPPDDEQVLAYVHDEVSARQATGALPHGPLLPPELVDDVAGRVRKALANLEKAGAFARGYDGVIVLGAAKHPWPGRKSRPPLLLEVDGRKVEIVHQRGCLFGRQDDRLLVELAGGATRPKPHDADFRQRIELLLLLLAGEIEPGSVARGAWLTIDGACSVADYELPGRDDALSWITARVREMSTDLDTPVLPLTALGDVRSLVELARAPEQRSERDAAYRVVWERIARTWRHRDSEVDGQTDALRTRDGLVPPAAEELFPLVAARFGLLVDMEVAS